MQCKSRTGGEFMEDVVIESGIRIIIVLIMTIIMTTCCRFIIPNTSGNLETLETLEILENGIAQSYHSLLNFTFTVVSTLFFVMIISIIAKRIIDKREYEETILGGYVIPTEPITYEKRIEDLMKVAYGTGLTELGSSLNDLMIQMRRTEKDDQKGNEF